MRWDTDAIRSRVRVISANDSRGDGLVQLALHAAEA